MFRWRFGIILLLLTPRLFTVAKAETDSLNVRAERILAAHCLECHGSDRSGELDLRSREPALEGGESGAVLVPGDAEASILIDYVASGTMPPDEKLADEEIETLRQWVASGAAYAHDPIDPYSQTTKKRAGYDWWSLQPITKPPVPEMPQAAPIDAFVLAKLGENELTMSGETDRLTYIRRVTYDLHGLPPTRDEICAFLEDSSPDAYERLVDRLLASPRFGERWGRHWLDVVRYAESNGFERDRIRTEFWRYRDYVIRAMNEDKPFDQFVCEQLAGDALQPGDPEALIATGFLVAGAKNDVDTVSELEKLMTRQDELDDFVSATGTTFLGLTLGCARCHDHKFDPIPAKDYYALTAVFSGLDRGNNVVATAEERAQHGVEARKLRVRIAATKKEMESILADARREKPVDDAAPDLPLPLARVEGNEDTFPAVQASAIRFVSLRTNTDSEPCLDELEVYGPDGETNFALASAGAVATASSLLPGFAIHKVEHVNDGEHGNARSWISNERGTGSVSIQLARPTKIDRVVWSRDREGNYHDRLPIEYRIEVSLDGENWRVVSSSERRPAYRSDAEPVDLAEPNAELLAKMSVSDRERFETLRQERDKAQAALDTLPPLPVSYSVKDRRPVETYVLHRGEVRSRGEVVGPAALSAIRGLDPDLDNPEDKDAGPARRLRLAEWITDPKNPLTARVIVNRIWHYHFGRGIVATPSDFGFQGDRPSHPELLDWLASDLVAHGWKLKRLHRMICLSRTYRQSSAQRPECVAVDADNRFLWRYNPWRLEAESLRDSILAVSGKLDLSLGGPSFRLFEYRDGNVPDYILVNRSDPSTWRRAVYMYNIRTFREPLLAAFDCPDPSVQTPMRQQSTTALQALSLLNNSFIVEQSGYFADRIRGSNGREAEAQDSGPAKQVEKAYELAFGRLPGAEESARAQQFVAQHGLEAFCRVLLNTNEFLYVR